MWGREMRAGLVFVLVSLVLGAALRDWGRAHEARLRDLVARLTESEETEPPRPGGSSGARPESGGAEAETGGADRAPAGRSGAGRAGSALRPAAIDPDRATAAEWERLPGIGPALARRIVTDREARGPFGSAAGLLRVRGIGPKTLERIRAYLPPDSPAAPESMSAN